jgi:hypothetical protein
MTALPRFSASSSNFFLLRTGRSAREVSSKASTGTLPDTSTSRLVSAELTTTEKSYVPAELSGRRGGWITMLICC